MFVIVNRKPYELSPFILSQTINNVPLIGNNREEKNTARKWTLTKFTSNNYEHERRYISPIKLFDDYLKVTPYT